MKTVDLILEKIKREGAVTAKKLSEDLGMTSMGARQHLQSLETDGLLEFTDIKAKVGRPVRHWSLTSKGHTQFSDKHADLTVQVIESVKKLFGEEGLAKVTAEREANVLEKYSKNIHSDLSLDEKLLRLKEQRESDGYMASLTKTEKGFVLTENHCPICKAAQSCPTLCQSELNVFQALLGPGITIKRIEHIINNERRCSYLIKSES